MTVSENEKKNAMIIECLTSFLSFWFIVPPHVHASISRGLPQLSAEYDEPLDFCRVNTQSVNIELNPSMVPFVTRFRVETDLKQKRKVLVTYANVNHNKLIYSKFAEITNNLAGNLVSNKFTQEPQIGQGLELIFYNWKKASF